MGIEMWLLILYLGLLSYVFIVFGKLLFDKSRDQNLYWKNQSKTALK
jgi:hypothetical protein